MLFCWLLWFFVNRSIVSGGNNAKATIGFVDLNSVRGTLQNVSDTVFSLDTELGRPFVFRATSATELNRWAKAIIEALSNLRITNERSAASGSSVQHLNILMANRALPEDWYPRCRNFGLVLISWRHWNLCSTKKETIGWWLPNYYTVSDTFWSAELPNYRLPPLLVPLGYQWFNTHPPTPDLL